MPHTVPWAIQNARKLGVVNLSKMGIDTLPEELFEKIPGTARIFNLSGNCLTELDSRLCDYVLVQRLIANGNCITAIPPAISRMTALRKLHLAGNRLTTLPDAFAAMQQLEHVDLSDNELSSLPPSFAALDLLVLNLASNRFAIAPPQLETMEWLERLNMSNNQLTHIPEAWMSLSKLKALELNNNSIADCPNVILQLCPDLEVLTLRKNTIKMHVLEAKEPYQEFEQRRRLKLKRHLDAGTTTLEDLQPADR